MSPDEFEQRFFMDKNELIGQADSLGDKLWAFFISHNLAVGVLAGFVGGFITGKLAPALGWIFFGIVAALVLFALVAHFYERDGG